ncbi:hypothetical protein ACFYY8_15290 [Streptosporangium sp. NPDC001559]|uniref:hypothetical protein n=1 Tax=Streptosporangium sp. NPDC001559 TaxID=3366187 RepID=UPI0036E0ABB0
MTRSTSCSALAHGGPSPSTRARCASGAGRKAYGEAEGRRGGPYGPAATRVVASRIGERAGRNAGADGERSARADGRAATDEHHDDEGNP